MLCSVFLLLCQFNTVSYTCLIATLTTTQGVYVASNVHVFFKQAVSSVLSMRLSMKLLHALHSGVARVRDYRGR